MSNSPAPAPEAYPTDDAQRRELVETFEQIRRCCDTWLERVRGTPPVGDAASADGELVDHAKFAEMWHPLTPEPMRQMGVAIFNRLVEQLGISESRKAAVLALAAMNDIRQLFGGEAVYFSRGHFEVSDQMKAEVVAKYNGQNRFELAKELGISGRRLQQIVDEARRARLNKLPKRQASSERPAPPIAKGDGSGQAATASRARQMGPAENHPWKR